MSLLKRLYHIFQYVITFAAAYLFISLALSYISLPLYYFLADFTGWSSNPEVVLSSPIRVWIIPVLNNVVAIVAAFYITRRAGIRNNWSFLEMGDTAGMPRFLRDGSETRSRGLIGLLLGSLIVGGLMAGIFTWLLYYGPLQSIVLGLICSILFGLFMLLELRYGRLGARIEQVNEQPEADKNTDFPHSRQEDL